MILIITERSLVESEVYGGSMGGMQQMGLCSGIDGGWYAGYMHVTSVPVHVYASILTLELATLHLNIIQSTLSVSGVTRSVATVTAKQSANGN